jgi:hypothetical protein
MFLASKSIFRRQNTLPLSSWKSIDNIIDLAAERARRAPPVASTHGTDTQPKTAIRLELADGYLANKARQALL